MQTAVEWHRVRVVLADAQSRQKEEGARRRWPLVRGAPLVNYGRQTSTVDRRLKKKKRRTTHKKRSEEGEAVRVVQVAGHGAAAVAADL